MEYPVHILPGKNKKIITCDISNFLLCRHFNLIEGLEVLNKTSGFIEPKYLASPKEQLADLSSNLLGVFTIEDSKIKITGDNKSYYDEYCQPDENVDIPVFEEDFIIDKSRHNWFIKIGDLIDEPVEYNRSPVNNFKAKCKILHTPTRGNYWHYSITWLMEIEGQPEAILFCNLKEDQKKRFKRKLATESLSIFQRLSTVKISDDPDIIKVEDYNS